MTHRQTSIPSQWLVADHRSGVELWGRVRMLPRGSGVLVLYRRLRERERSKLMARLRLISALRGLVVVDEAAGAGARVHDAAEIRQAALGRAQILFLSPVYPTRSHPGREPLTRMQAAALIRLSGLPVIALGGMNAKRFGRVAQLGFRGWAGIDAWRFRT
jgi:thiamine-phosphate pyrophosphorylase